MVPGVEGVADGADRAPEEEAVRDAVEPLGHAEEPLVALGRARLRSESVSAAAMRLGIGHQVEGRAVLEEASPLRVERDQVELAPQVAPRLGEDPARGRRAW